VLRGDEDFVPESSSSSGRGGSCVFVHGYHPAAKMPPSTFPASRSYSIPHSILSTMIFLQLTPVDPLPRLIATSVKLTHLPFDYAPSLLAFAVDLFVPIGVLCGSRPTVFPTSRRAGRVLLVAATLTVPVAGTALFLLDPYLNPRSLSAPAILFALANVLDRRY